MITLTDYNAYITKRVKAEALARLYGVSVQTVRVHLRKYNGTTARHKLTQEERHTLKVDILSAVPHDRENSIKDVLIKHNLKNISQALALLKVKNLSELRYNSPDFQKTLAKLHLKFINDTLYSPQNRGRQHDARQLILTETETEELIDNPLEWIKANISRIKPLYKREKKP